MQTQLFSRQFKILTGLSLIVVFWAVFNPLSPSMPIVENIEQTDANVLINSGRTLVLDVREKAAFDKGHLPTAISVPIGDLDKRLIEFEAYKADEVIVYCNDGSTRGPRATKKLNDAGFPGAKNLKGGVEGWKSSNYRLLTK